MSTTRIPVISREFFRVPVSIRIGGSTIDPTSLPLQWAIVPKGVEPVDADWKDGSWETAGTRYLARILVGDSSATFPLTLGQVYDAWMRITETPERPARLVGRIRGV